MIKEPLTAAQKKFAEKHHSLIYAFLKKKQLERSEYYDVVVFSYLDSVVMYLSRPGLKQYAFSTIAYHKMQQSLGNYRRYLSCPMRKGITVSFERFGKGRDCFGPEDYLASEDNLMAELEMDLLMHEIASRVTKPQMEIIRMKADGYGVCDIAKEKKMTVQSVADILADVHEAVHSVCYG